jgi:hypothetical protein
VQLRDGNQFRDVFVESKGRFVALKERGRIEKASLRALSAYRNHTT